MTKEEKNISIDCPKPQHCWHSQSSWSDNFKSFVNERCCWCGLHRTREVSNMEYEHLNHGEYK